ncbi:hypothetical protein TWF569_004787 [Orbilia oligospora]|uniref:Uncharacterized protein n=1 Tax=Orbilia oligospora TaxID=2813651 RepID=A0A4Z0XZT2_ORBOL|nr:hypothetical protein TWF706_011856 [Orbilia oligospora]KAF3087822.1 hypothetical protein TWF103_001321 [Orbilia oligospora]KAF3095306.1 hypothetical protein TWF102_007354 [Orbilia oligospora]KAF3118784.1 hypothetical protein TWF569_004787 [Orbilia oligospora]KAF3119360.1 hypothetical protein TWF594_004897 [Orbilia oligospora]
MEHTGSQAPPEITFSTSPRSASFIDRVLRRASGSHGRIPTLNLPAEVPSNNTLDNTSSRPQSRSSSRSSHKRAPLTIDTSVASASMVSNKKSKSTHLTVVETTNTRSSSRSRSRSRTRRSPSPSPNIDIMSQSSRVASINHVGRHTNDWLFGGFHLTSKIGAQRGRAK